MKLKSGLLSALFTAGILLIGFFIGGLYPFGEGTISWCDMNQQAIPLLCDFKDILQGNKGFFLNFANGGGMNFYGVFFFFLSSPFSFLVAFVSKADIPFLMNILVILKLSVAGFTAAYTFKALNRSLAVNFSAILGACYALCGYGMLFYQNIMWLDSMYLFPLVILGLYKIIKSESPLLLLLSLSACIIVNYYISFMVFLFVIISMGFFALFFRNKDRKIYVNLGFCGVFSLLITAVVWVPSFLQYASSGRSTSAFYELENNRFYAPYETTLPVLLGSGIILAILVLFIPKFSVSDKKSKFLFTLFVLMAIPLVIEPINLIWHTGSYMSFPARYGFITVFMGLLLAANSFSQTETAPKSKYGVVTVLAAIVTSAGIFMLSFTEENITVLSNYVQTLWGNESSLKGLAILFMVAAAAYFAVIFFMKRKALSRIAATLLLSGILVAESLCSVAIYMETAQNKLNLNNYQNFIALGEALKDDRFYRVNTTHKITDANMTGAAGFNSVSHYTSLNSASFMESAKQLGYSGYWMETGNWGGSVISDALLSVGYTVYEENGGFALKENPYYMGLGIKAQGDIKENLSHKDRLLALGEAFAGMTHSENIVKKYEPSEYNGCLLTETDEGHSLMVFNEEAGFTYEIEVKGKQRLYFDCYNGFSNNLVEEINESFAVYVNGQLLAAEYPTQRQNGLLDLGSFENEKVNITLSVLKTADCCSLGVFGVDEEKLSEIISNTEGPELSVENGNIKGEIASAGKYFLSIPYDENLSIKLNGEKIEFTKVLSGFTAIETENGGSLEISYLPRGLGLSAIVSVIGIIGAFLYIKFSAKLKMLDSKFKNIVYGIFMGVFTAATIMVYIISVFVNLSDMKL